MWLSIWWSMHKADVGAKNYVSTALIDGLFDSLIGLRLFGTAVVNVEGLHRVNVCLSEGSH